MVQVDKFKTDGSGQLSFGTVSIPEDQPMTKTAMAGSRNTKNYYNYYPNWVDSGIEVTYTPVASNSTASNTFSDSSSSKLW